MKKNRPVQEIHSLDPVVVAVLVAFSMCLLLCAAVVWLTGDTSGLQDVALVVSTFGAATISRSRRRRRTE